jgi:hypothetical protein
MNHSSLNGGITLPIIYPNPNFIWWFAQSLQTGKYPTMELTYVGYLIVRQRINSDPSPFYQMFQLPAWREYSGLNIPSIELYIGLSLPDMTLHSVTQSGELLKGGLKISSIPYDLQGTEF